MHRSALAVVALVLMSCASGAPAPEPAPPPTEPSEGGEAPPADAPGEGGEAPPAPVAWADMDGQQKAKFMMEHVVPTMKPLFQGFDAERFANFGCKTCHGENSREVAMKMPNTLAPLDPATLGSLFQSEEPMAKFMVGTVRPTMAELLGAAPFDPKTGQGFGCLSCHATKTE